MNHHHTILRLLLSAALLCGVLLYAGAKKRKDKTPSKKETVTLDPKDEAWRKTPNLIRNGTFDQGQGKLPKFWADVDGLTAYWAQTGGKPGKCLELNTAYQQSDKKEYLKNPDAYKDTGPSSGGQYGVVGAHEGAWAYSMPIDVRPDDMYFIVSADVFATAHSDSLMYPQILVRGYVPVTPAEVGKKIVWFHHYFKNNEGYEDVFGPDEIKRPATANDWKQVFRQSIPCRVPVPNQWVHIELGVALPKTQRFRPSRLLLKPYAYWPPGIYRFDNIELHRATKADYDAVNARRPSIREVIVPK